MLLMNAGKAVVPQAPVTFDAASAAAVTLTNGDLTATNTGTTSTNQGAKALEAKSTGKWMMEYTITVKNGTPGGNVGCGVGTSASTFANMGNSATIGGMVFVPTGNIWNNNHQTKSLTARAQGDVLTMAVDVDAGLFWARVAPSGSWNNVLGADPATATGGLAIPAGSAYEPFVTFGGTGGTSGNAFTANFGASAFTGTIPTGFHSWDNSQSG